ncbi:MAG: hypothetical protein ABIC95_02670 [archaeon]
MYHGSDIHDNPHDERYHSADSTHSKDYQSRDEHTPGQDYLSKDQDGGTGELYNALSPEEESEEEESSDLDETVDQSKDYESMDKQDGHDDSILSTRSTSGFPQGMESAALEAIASETKQGKRDRAHIAHEITRSVDEVISTFAVNKVPEVIDLDKKKKT